MHRRIQQENSSLLIAEPLGDEKKKLSAAAEAYVEGGKIQNGPLIKQIFSCFLSRKQSTDKNPDGTEKFAGERSLSFAVDLRVLVPEYEANRKIWFDAHYEGGYIYRDRLFVLARPDAQKPGGWVIRHAFESQTPNPTEGTMAEVLTVMPNPDGRGITFTVPIVKATAPGLDAVLRVVAIPWNT
jgi:hypothetical protein